MESHHISGTGEKGSGKCIDIHLDSEQGEIRICDLEDHSNRMRICAEDWNELIDRIRSGRIGKIPIS
jgi:hypothetical protein